MSGQPIPGEPGEAAGGQDAPSGTTQRRDAVGASAPTAAGLEEELRGWLELAVEAFETGNQFSRLALLELKLAAGDSARLLILALAAVPLVILAWLGLSVLLAWLAYSTLGSIPLGLACFTLIQVLALLVMGLAAKRYARSLALPATRRQWRAMMETEDDDGSQASGS